jgi:hypothetical protein
MVQSHLVHYGFVKDYTVWKYHREGDSSATGASGGNSSTTLMVAVVNDGGQQPSSLAAGTIQIMITLALMIFSKT